MNEAIPVVDVMNGNNNNGFGGMWGDGLWAIIILAMLGFGGYGYGGGFGGFGGFGGVGLNGALTRAELYDGFAMQNIDSAVRGVQQGICDSTYALNNSLMTGFHGVDRAFCDLSHQISDCCCENRAAIADLKYTFASESCNTRNLIQNTTRDIIDSQNAGTRAILDFLTNDKIDSLRSENQALKFAASQSAQNAFFTANQEAQTAELIRRLGRDVPIPAYMVPNPNCCYGNYGGNGYGGNGCGCGC